jgi:phage/plasmid-like protein (TIGR03299 family)
MQTTTIFEGSDKRYGSAADNARAHEIAEGRLPAFLGLARHTGGTYVEDNTGMTVEQGLRAAGLDWTVQVVEGVNVPVITDTGVTTVNYPDHRGTVRVNKDGSASRLGIVKTKYRAMQNVDAGGYGQAIVDEFGANLVAVGQFGDPMGSKTYMALRLPETMLVAGQDAHDLYVTVLNDHTGNGGVTALIAPIRLDCLNQTHATFRGAPLRLSLRHTGHMTGKVAQAREVLDLTHKWVPAFQQAADRLLDVAVSDALFEQIIKDVIAEPTGTTKRSLNGYQAKVDGIKAARQSPTNAFARETAYGAYNAFVEWADFASPVNNDHLATSRFERIMAGGMDPIKDKAFDRLLALTA